MTTIEVRYTCNGCGVVKRPVLVRERQPDEDVIAWTQFAGGCVGDDHRAVSPGCPADKADLWIPMTGAAYIGQALRH